MHIYSTTDQSQKELKNKNNWTSDSKVDDVLLPVQEAFSIQSM